MKYLLSALFLVLFSLPVRAEVPVVSAKSAVLLEYGTGKVLYAKSANEKLPMASTTKIMTALVALEKSNLSETVTVGKNAAYQEGSSMYLKPGEKVTMETLLYGLMLSSGNDAAVAIAEHICGSEEEFAKKMTEKAKTLGCISTQFQNASGLPDEEHFTTALELARITGKALENEKFCEIVNCKSMQIGGRSLKNHNKMLTMYDGAIGVKTGFTKAAGRTLVSAAERDGIRLIAVTLNAPDDWTDHKNMLDYGYKYMEKRQIVKKDDVATEIAVSGSDKEKITIVYGHDYHLPVLKTENTEVKVLLPMALNAPVLQGEEVGKAEIFLESVKMGEVSLLSGDTAEKLSEPTFATFITTVFLRWKTFYLK